MLHLLCLRRCRALCCRRWGCCPSWSSTPSECTALMCCTALCCAALWCITQPCCKPGRLQQRCIVQPASPGLGPHIPPISTACHSSVAVAGATWGSCRGTRCRRRKWAPRCWPSARSGFYVDQSRGLGALGEAPSFEQQAAVCLPTTWLTLSPLPVALLPCTGHRHGASLRPRRQAQ